MAKTPEKWIKRMKQNQDKPKLVYIISPSYSGSTLLTFLLARHSLVSTIGELKATAHGNLDTYMCSCGSRLLDCSFWRDIEKAARADGLDFSLENFNTHFAAQNPFADKVLGAQVRGPLFESVRSLCIQLQPSIRGLHDRLLEQNYILSNLIRERQGGEFFLDGSKDPNRLLFFLRSEKWNVFVIRMTRDGRAQCNSQRKKPYFLGNYQDAVWEWRKTIEQMNRVCARVPNDKIHYLTYETLCTAPASALQGIWDFLGLPSLETEPGAINLKSAEQHILGNEMRTSSQINIRMDQSWKEQVTEEEMTCFERIAGPMNRLCMDRDKAAPAT